MVRGCDIASLDVVSRVELLRLKRETAVWLDGLQRAAAEHGIGFMIGQGPSDNSWILRYALSRRMVEFVLQSLSESERDSPITAAMMNDESAAVYLSYWLSLLSEIDVTPVQLNPQSSNPDAA